jgi:hypothetical protein
MEVSVVVATILALEVIGTGLDHSSLSARRMSDRFSIADIQSDAKNQSKAKVDNEKKQGAKADKNLILIGCVEEGPQNNTFLLTTVSSDKAAGGQHVHLIGGDKGMLAGQVGQKIQVSGQVDAKGPGLKKTVAGVAAAAAPVAGVAAGVATAGAAAAAGAAAGEIAKNTADAEQKKQDAKAVALPRFNVIAVRGLGKSCDAD